MHVPEGCMVELMLALLDIGHVAGHCVRVAVAKIVLTERAEHMECVTVMVLLERVEPDIAMEELETIGDVKVPVFELEEAAMDAGPEARDAPDDIVETIRLDKEMPELWSVPWYTMLILAIRSVGNVVVPSGQVSLNVMAVSVAFGRIALELKD